MVSNFTMSGKEILFTKMVPASIAGVIISYDGDAVFDNLMAFARQVAKAVDEGKVDAFPLRTKKLSKDESGFDKNGETPTEEIPLNIREAILRCKGEAREKLVSELFHSEMMAVRGTYSEPVAENLAKWETFYTKVVDEANTILKKGGEISVDINQVRLWCRHSSDNLGELEAIVVGHIVDKYNTEFLGLRDEERQIDARYDINEDGELDGVEETRYFAKSGVDPELGFTCRHYASEMAAMLAAYGNDAKVFGCFLDSAVPHLLVITEHGNAIEATIEDSSEIYHLVINGSEKSIDYAEYYSILLRPNRAHILTSSGASEPFNERQQKDSEIVDQYFISKAGRAGSLSPHDLVAQFYRENLVKAGPINPESVGVGLDRPVPLFIPVAPTEISPKKNEKQDIEGLYDPVPR